MPRNMDYDERTALHLQLGQDQRFRASKDKTTFYHSKHEKSISAKIRQHRKMSDTYDPDNPNRR